MDSAKRLRTLQKARQIGGPVLLGLLAWLVWAMTGDPYQVKAQPAGPEDAVDLTIQPPERLPMDRLLATARQREMFKQSILYEVKKADTVNALQDMKFLGVMRQNGALRAILMNETSGQSTFYGEGDMLEDLEIKEIHEDRVVFGHGEQTLDLRR